MRPLLARLLALFHRRRFDRDLSDEISAHLEFATAEHMARGMSQEEAHRAAVRRFGGVLQTEEACRDRQGFPILESMWQDVRYAARSMRKSLAFASAAILTLALGIGATTAIFNVVNGLLLRPLPFPDANRIVAVSANHLKEHLSRDSTSFLDFSDWQRQSHAFTDMAAYRSDRFNITGDGAPEPLTGLRASHELFGVLRVTPVIGRAFDAQEQHGRNAVALISHGLWTRRYGRDPQILNRTILLNEVSHAVIGVLPAGFQFPPFVQTDVVVPVPERPSRSTGYIFGVARLKPGVQPAAAQEELGAIARRLKTRFPNRMRAGASTSPVFRTRRWHACAFPCWSFSAPPSACC